MINFNKKVRIKNIKYIVLQLYENNNQYQALDFNNPKQQKSEKLSSMNPEIFFNHQKLKNSYQIRKDVISLEKNNNIDSDYSISRSKKKKLKNDLKCNSINLNKSQGQLRVFNLGKNDDIQIPNTQRYINNSNKNFFKNINQNSYKDLNYKQKHAKDTKIPKSNSSIHNNYLKKFISNNNYNKDVNNNYLIPSLAFRNEMYENYNNEEINFGYNNSNRNGNNNIFYNNSNNNCNSVIINSMNDKGQKKEISKINNDNYLNKNNFNNSNNNILRNSFKNKQKTQCKRDTISNLSFNFNNNNDNIIVNGNGKIENSNIKLTNKEKAFEILSKSPVLRLCERIIFSQSTKNLKNLISIPQILKKNSLLLEEKRKELKKKMNECYNKINESFTASRTAEITFNFILSNDEEELKSLLKLKLAEKKKIYSVYLKLLYLVFNESFEGVEENKLICELYNRLEEKGFKSIRDCLYFIFIKKRERISIVYNIDNITNLMNSSPEEVFGNHCELMSSRFILFTSFLFKEIINYANGIKDAVQLKLNCENLLDIINKKLFLYQNKYNNLGNNCKQRIKK